MASHHARVISDSEMADLAMVVDTDVQRAEQLATLYGGRASTRVEQTTDCDAVIVATPTESHAEIATRVLQAGIPLLVEKPIANDVQAVEAVIALSEATETPLMCGFVERFNPVITAAMNLMDVPPLHMVCLRHSPPAPRISTSVVYDLLIHDIDLALRLAGSDALSAVAGTTWTPDGATFAEISDCTLRFEDGMIATLSASRMGQRKIRTYLVGTQDSLIELDLLRQDITVYRHVAHQQVGDPTTYRAETIIDIPFVRQVGEPLALQLNHFVSLARRRINPEDERRTLLAPHIAAAEVAART